jgi:putative hydrolase of the HAD superfamily
MIEAVVFDLDDTLYPERDFVASGFRAVSHHLATDFGCRFADVYDTMMTVFEREGRRRVFPVVIERFLKSQIPVQELVQVYRRHSPCIRLLPEAELVLRSLRDNYPLGVITDGLPEVQKRKVQALNLEPRVDSIVYTWEHEKEKPDPDGFLLIARRLGVSAERTIVVGDNPAKDCRGARAAGMKSVWVCRDRAQNETDSDYVVHSLLEIAEILGGAKNNQPRRHKRTKVSVSLCLCGESEVR